MDKTMGSLIKMNHKFLSKSSWTIRPSSTSAANTTTRRNPPINSVIRRKGSDRFTHKMIERHERQGSVRSETNRYGSAQSCSSATASDNNYVNQSSESNGLRRQKGMSYSVTDLRELTDRPDFDWLEASDGFQQEIKDRRHEMYIAEIEMDSFLQLGPTLRLALLLSAFGYYYSYCYTVILCYTVLYYCFLTFITFTFNA